ncbi:MAG: methyltransferase domain-containing protein [Deltaproteobacteria bacterium]
MTQPRSGAHILLPACGTGRYAHALAERGLAVEAFDINAHMLAFASQHRPHANVSYRVADMAQPLGELRDCAAAFTLCNSFRYLLEQQDVARHLVSVRRRLVPGGLYVVELALNVDDPAELGEERRWELDYGNIRVRASWTLVELHAPTSLEVARIRVETSDGQHVDFQANQPQRLWSSSDLERVCRDAGFEMGGVFQLDGSVAMQPQHPGRYYVALRANSEGV